MRKPYKWRSPPFWRLIRSRSPIESYVPVRHWRRRNRKRARLYTSDLRNPQQPAPSASPTVKSRRAPMWKVARSKLHSVRGRPLIPIYVSTRHIQRRSRPSKPKSKNRELARRVRASSAGRAHAPSASPAVVQVADVESGRVLNLEAFNDLSSRSPF